MIVAVLYLMVGHDYAVRPVRLGQLLLAGAGLLLLLPLFYIDRAYGFSVAFLRYLTFENAIQE